MDVLREHDGRPSYVVVEDFACYGMPVGDSSIRTIKLIGRIQEICDQLDYTFVPIRRKEVVTHLCGTAKGKDGNVIQALKDRWGDKGTKKAPGFFYGFASHAWQAFAVGVTFVDQIEARVAATK